MGFLTTADGLAGLEKMPEWNDIKIIFDATSAKAHNYNWEIVEKYPDKRIIDLTPAAIGPFLIPPVNFDESHNVRNVNMVTCGASIASKSAGPGTRANIDEFTETTAQAIEKVGGAEKGKAIIILNPAEPPVVMRDTIFTLSEQADREEIRASVHQMVKEVQKYVPGYTLHQEVQFDDISEDKPVYIEGLGYRSGLKTSVLLQVIGAGHYLPEYAGNLDIMTSAAMATGERFCG